MLQTNNCTSYYNSKWAPMFTYNFIVYLLLSIRPLNFEHCNTVVSYYKNLIEHEKHKSFSYIPATSNYYFLNGSHSCENKTGFGEYDFVIVGAGTSGSTLTYKLSQNENWTILLLEAGSNETDFSIIPHYAPYLLNSSMDWGYRTIPQEYICNVLSDKRCKYYRGKSVGGSGAINDMQYVRGNKEDYNSWSSSGNKGWSYEELLPYFIELEDTNGFGDPSYRGRKGPIQVSLPKPPSPLLNNFLEANVEMGREILDYNGSKQIGVGVLQLNTRNGKRESGGNVFVSRAESKTNVKVVRMALVTKVLIGGENLEAYGVEFTKEGCNYTVRAKKEVILSAGSINTPQLLLLSGIGPKEDLEKLGIAVNLNVSDVGGNLQDHVVHNGLIFSTNFSIPTLTLDQSIRTYLKGFGPLTLALNFEGIAFFRVKNSTLPEGVPDIQLDFNGPTTLQDENSNHNLIQIFPVLLHPKSRGSITLSSASPYEFPVINMTYLADEDDRQIFYEAIEAVFELIESPSFRKINATFLRPNIPECDKYEFRSKDYWICNTKYYGYALWHSTSTAAMGLVVDDTLKLKGVAKLRVVDCSVIPNVTSGNTNVPAFMIGAKAADLIRNDYE